MIAPAQTASRSIARRPAFQAGMFVAQAGRGFSPLPDSHIQSTHPNAPLILSGVFYDGDTL
jgi:hypothetical protein